MKSLSKSLTLAALFMATLFAGCKNGDDDLNDLFPSIFLHDKK